jgi:phospholipase/carboxylesterase
MAIGSVMRNFCPPGNFPQGKPTRADLTDQADRGIDEGPFEITMVIGARVLHGIWYPEMLTKATFQCTEILSSIIQPGSLRRAMSFIHRFEQGSKACPTLLLLHGTGGNETDLIEFGRAIAPRSNLLSPRGNVLENGMPRFFRRFAHGVFDLQDVKFRVEELLEFIKVSARMYDFDPENLIAMGYSNGANMAAALLSLHERSLAGAILFRPMMVLVPEKMPDLSRCKILVCAGDHDSLIDPSKTSDLISFFETAGAHVAVHHHPGGHELGRDDFEAAQKWCRNRS